MVYQVLKSYNFTVTALIFASLLLNSIGLCSDKVTGTIVNTKHLAPIQANVYLLTSTASGLFDRSHRYYIQASRTDGVYIFKNRELIGRHEETIAIAEGYYPSFTIGGGGDIQLTKMPKDKIRIREGVISIAEGASMGFNFARGVRAASAISDIIPNGESAKVAIRFLNANGKGGVQELKQTIKSTSWSQTWCAFFNAIDAPKEGYVTKIDLEHRNNSVLFVRCRDGVGMAKLLLSHGKVTADKKTRSYHFRYIYSPSGMTLASECSPEYFKKECLLKVKQIVLPP